MKQLPRNRVQFLDSPIDVLTMSETLELIVSEMAARTKLTHVAINVAKLVKMRSDPQLRADVTSADIIGIDGMGIVWGARLLGIAVPERVSGIDLMSHLLAECTRKGFRPYFLGARPEVVAAAAAAAKRANPGLEIAGVRDGYFQADEASRIVAEINASRADCLFIGMPTPHKERFLAAHRSVLDVPFVMGVGGSFDVMAGKVARAPQWAQGLGLEWLFRTLQEPRRMFWRYAETNARFALLLLQELLAERRQALAERWSRTTGAIRWPRSTK